MGLDDVVQLQISVSSKSPVQAGFGTTLIAGFHDAWVSDLVREYSKPSDLLDDGFVVTDHLYRMALALKGQNPSPRNFKVGRLRNAYTHTFELTPTVTTEGFVYSWAIAGHAGTYTVPNGASVQSICEAIQPTIHGYAETTATEDNAKISVSAASPGVIISVQLGRGWTVLDTTTATNLAADLAAIVAEDNDFYGLVTDTNSAAAITAAATAIEATRKLYVAQSADTAILNPGSTTDIAYTTAQSAFARTAGIYHHEIGTWANAAWLGQMLSEIPGRATWVYKTLAGIPVTTLSASAETALKNKKWTGYTTLGGLNLTNPNGGGRTSSGEFADTIHGIDWCYARIQERVIGALANAKKIPYTDAGVDVIKAQILAVLNQGIRNGLFAADPAPIVTAPKVAEVAPGDRINRLLPDVEFTAWLAGAIHATSITGVVQL
jgi:hypothetical protein